MMEFATTYTPWRLSPCAFLLLLLGASCTPAIVEPGLPLGRVEPLTTEEIGTVAALLRLEDRRDFSSTLIGAAAEDPTPAVRERAAMAAGRIGGSDARVLLRSLLLDPDSSVAAAAALMVGHLRDTVAVPVLATMLDPTEATARPTVAGEAAAALGRMPVFTARGVLNAFLADADTADLRLRPVVREAIVASWRAGETGLDPFRRWLYHSDPEIRWRATFALTRPTRPEAVSVILPLLDDPDPTTRSFAVQGLAAPAVAGAAVSGDEALAHVIRALADSSYSVRIEAIRVLGSYDAPEAIQALRSALQRRPDHEVVTAIEAGSRLGAVGSALLPDLRAIASDRRRHAYVRQTSVVAIVGLDPAGALAFLESISQDPDWAVRRAAARSLDRLRESGLPLLQRLARDPDPRVATAAVDAAVVALRPANVGRITPLLLELVHAADVHLRAAAINGLSWLADPATFPLLLDAYDRSRRDEENVAAIASIEAIAEIGLTGALAPERAFFARFPRSPDPEVRRRVAARFGAAAHAAWGDLTELESPARGDQYLQYAREWIAPPPRHHDLPRIRIETELGTLEAVLYADEAPLTAVNFLRLAASGFFDGQVWARLVPNFVVQGGDPRGDTSGGPGYTIRDEPNRRRFLAGTLGMALSGPDSGGSQFFVTHSPQPHLDGGYTAFGEILVGHEILERLLPGHQVYSVREMQAVPEIQEEI